MPEGINVEVAAKLGEKEQHDARNKRRWEEIVEIFEAILLAMVAITTAFAGYQAAQWDGLQSLRYGESSTSRFDSEEKTNLGEQHLVADASLLNGWLQARHDHDQELMDLYVRRFSDEYRAAFHDWVLLDPLKDREAPAGPAYMSTYRNPWIEQGRTLNEEAEKQFAEGTEARETADKYVRYTVLFAMILFLVAIAQRFKIRAVRIGTLALSCTILTYALIATLSLPRI